MRGTHLRKPRRTPERITDQAWEYLINVVNPVGTSARHTARGTTRSARRAGGQLSGRAGARIVGVADEARQRAGRAYDALTGRRPGLPWGWLAAAVLVGAAVAWAGTASRTVLARSGKELPARDRLELVDADRPASAVRLDTTA